MVETIFTGGPILTMDDENPRVESVLIRDGLIHSVGQMREVRRECESSDPAVLSLDGRTLVPGFNDCHLHTVSLGLMSGMVSLAGLNKQQILEKLASADWGESEIIMASDWDFPTCPDPHRRDLDAVFPDRPVFLNQFSGHGAWVNTALLKWVGIEADSEWDMGGPVLDENGEMTGVLREPGDNPAIKKMWMKLFNNRGMVRSGFQRGMELLNQAGITSAQDNTWFPGHLNILRRLHATEGLGVRFSCWSAGFMGPLDIWFSNKRFDKSWYHLGPRKYFIDGALSSRTAWLREPYSNDPDNKGTGKGVDSIRRWLSRATRGGRQMASHAIGDAAVGAYCDAAEVVAGAVGSERFASLRHRIEHGQMISSQDIERIARLGMVVSAQPHAAADPEKDVSLLGEKRAANAYAYRSLLDAGVRLAFGSDTPSESTYHPMIGVHLAVNRPGGQAITPWEALQCYTVGSAYAEFQEQQKGMIRAGYFADFAVLSDDPTSVNDAAIRDIEVLSTITGGSVRYQKEQVLKDDREDSDFVVDRPPTVLAGR